MYINSPPCSCLLSVNLFSHHFDFDHLTIFFMHPHLCLFSFLHTSLLPYPLSVCCLHFLLPIARFLCVFYFPLLVSCFLLPNCACFCVFYFLYCFLLFPLLFFSYASCFLFLFFLLPFSCVLATSRFCVLLIVSASRSLFPASLFLLPVSSLFVFPCLLLRPSCTRFPVSFHLFFACLSYFLFAVSFLLLSQSVLVFEIDLVTNTIKRRPGPHSQVTATGSTDMTLLISPTIRVSPLTSAAVSLSLFLLLLFLYLVSVSV